MKFSVLNRKVHYWASLVIAVPVLIVIASGLILQWKKQWPWVQPPAQRGVGRFPTIAFDRILQQCRTVPEAEIESWADIDRLDVQPRLGMLKVRARNSWEIQLDSDTGKVLQVAYRRSDLIESIHDGSWFHPSAKLGVFFPAALILLLLWFTGMYLFWLPIVVKRRRQARRVTVAPAAPASGNGTPEPRPAPTTLDS